MKPTKCKNLELRNVSKMEKKQFWCFLIPHFPDVEIKLQMPHCFVSLHKRNFKLSFSASFYLQHRVTWAICCIIYCYEASEHITAKLCDNSRKKMGLIYSSLGKHSPESLWFPWIPVRILSVPLVFLSHYFDIPFRCA